MEAVGLAVGIGAGPAEPVGVCEGEEVSEAVGVCEGDAVGEAVLNVGGDPVGEVVGALYRAHTVGISLQSHWSYPETRVYTPDCRNKHMNCGRGEG